MNRRRWLYCRSLREAVVACGVGLGRAVVVRWALAATVVDCCRMVDVVAAVVLDAMPG